MLKTLSLALLVAGMLLALVAFDNIDATAQAGQAAGPARLKELAWDLGAKGRSKLGQIPAGKFLRGSPRKRRNVTTMKDWPTANG